MTELPLPNRILTLLHASDRSQADLMDELRVDRNTLASALSGLKDSGKVESYFDPCLMYRIRQSDAPGFPWFRSSHSSSQ